MLPDSRRPRRLPIVIRTIATIPISTRSRGDAGAIEKIWSRADEVDTATVIT